MFDKHGRIDVIVNNAGYGLSGCAEEPDEADINKILAANLTATGFIIHDSLPYLRKQGGQAAYPANSMYHTTKFGIGGFLEPAVR